MKPAPVTALESLEDRRLLSAAIQVHDGTLTVRGTRRADTIQVSQLPPGGALIVPVLTSGQTPPPPPSPGLSLYVTINGRTRRLDSKNIRRIRVDAGNGDDRVQMSGDPFYTGSRLTVVTISQALPSTLIGGAGNDTLIGGDGNDSISGGAGHDAVAGAIGDDIVDGDANADTLNGGAGKDVLRGGNGDDRIVSDADDVLLGGNGIDFYSPADPSAIPNSSPRAHLPIFDMEGLASPDGTPSFRIDGGTLIVFGTRRSDHITVQNSTLSDGVLNVFVNQRGFGLLPQTHIQKIRIEAGDGDDHVEIGPETRVNMMFIPEYIPLQQDLELIGGNGNDTLIAGDGADTLLGGPGDDELAGGDGNDHLDGGPGADILRGNAGTNQLLN